MRIRAPQPRGRRATACSTRPISPLNLLLSPRPLQPTLPPPLRMSPGSSTPAATTRRQDVSDPACFPLLPPLPHATLACWAASVLARLCLVRVAAAGARRNRLARSVAGVTWGWRPPEMWRADAMQPLPACPSPTPAAPLWPLTMHASLRVAHSLRAPHVAHPRPAQPPTITHICCAARHEPRRLAPPTHFSSLRAAEPDRPALRREHRAR